MNLPVLHQAVLDENLQEIMRLKNDPREYAARDTARDFLGFTAKELAKLLGKKESLKLLEPEKETWIKVQKEGQASVTRLSIREFEEFFSISYIKLPLFKDYVELQNVIKNCPWLLRNTVVGTEHRRLGSLYRSKIFAGFTEDVAICFIDSVKGYGVFAEKPLACDTFIGTYCGYVRQIRRFHPELNNYCLHYPTRFGSFHYFVVDAKEFGNEMRFINHSKTPNLRPFCLVDRGLLHIAFFTTREITQGEELTFTYGASFKSPIWK